MRFSKFLACIFISATAFATTSTAFAQSHSAQLSQCIVQSTSAKDRLALAQWMAVTMFAHPGLKGFSSITPQQVQGFNKNAAAIFERILTRDCETEFANTAKYEGAQAAAQTFQILGAIAMEELAGHPAVAERFNELLQYMDPKTFDVFTY